MTTTPVSRGVNAATYRADRQKAARKEWLAANRCQCGATATRMRGSQGGIPKTIWGCQPEVRAERLAAIPMDFWCDACWQAKIERNHAIQRERDWRLQAERRRERRAADRIARGLPPYEQRPKAEPKPKLVKVREPRVVSVAKTKAERAKTAEKALLLFTLAHECRCGVKFPRYALLVRHRRQGCKAA